MGNGSSGFAGAANAGGGGGALPTVDTGAASGFPSAGAIDGAGNAGAEGLGDGTAAASDAGGWLAGRLGVALSGSGGTD